MKTRYALAAAAIALCSCVEKPATEPESTIYFQATEQNFPILDARFRDFAKTNNFRYGAGAIGASDNTNFTIHFVRRDAQIIGVDPFVQHCFRLSFYKTLRIDHASDTEMQQLEDDVVSIVGNVPGITLLSKEQADELGC